ncbi:hypothetical protein MKW98_026008, partial [Papaver atlanticum]
GIPNSLTAVPANPQPFTSEDEDIELALTLSASLQYTVDSNISPSSVYEAGSSSSDPVEITSLPSIVSTTVETQGIKDDQMNYESIYFGGHYAPTNAGHIDMSTATTAYRKPAKTGASTDDVSGTISSCIICYDAPREGACIPCGHMVGCVSCLNEIKTKNWGCPVCRNKIDGVIRIYNV